MGLLTSSRLDDVVAVAGLDRVGLGIHDDHIAGLATLHVFDVAEVVGAGVLAFGVSFGEIHHNARGDAGKVEGVAAFAAVNVIVAVGVRCDDGVIARAAVDHIGIGAAHQSIVAVAAEQGVFTVLAEDRIVALFAEDDVVARPGMDDIVALQGIDDIIAHATLNEVGGGRAVGHGRPIIR